MCPSRLVQSCNRKDVDNPIEQCWKFFKDNNAVAKVFTPLAEEDLEWAKESGLFNDHRE
jgi:ligand-binding SRPBCC domain-containing protein